MRRKGFLKSVEINKMNYILKHKNIDVAALKIDPVNYSFRKVELLDVGHFPVGTTAAAPSLYDWWISRNIPASREGAKRYFRENKISGVSEFALRTYGLSLTDQYWIVPEKDTHITWESVNFFDNEFIGGKSHVFVLEAGGITPDRATSGQLPKRWVIEDGVRFLIKRGMPNEYLEAYNEKIGSIVCKHLGINHVDYDVVIESDIVSVNTVSSKCACFIDRDTELVTANQLLESDPFAVGSLYNHFINCFNSAGVPKAVAKIDEMLVLDYIIANTDRHYWNFGLIRNADMLETVSFAPLFDFGNSMWHRTDIEKIIPGMDVVSYSNNPFTASHKEQIKNVSDFSWFDSSALKAAADEVENVLLLNPRCSARRTQNTIGAFKERVSEIEKIAYEKNKEGKVYQS